MAKAELKIVPAPLAIESGIPLPTRNRGGSSGGVMGALRALHAANIGDSLLVTTMKYSANLYVYAERVAPRGWYKISKVEGGFRIWKVA